MLIINLILGTLLFAVLGGAIGCFLAGIDRKLTAKLQGRVGPSLLQPYYDVRKLLEKDNVSLNGAEGVYVTCALVFTCVAGGIFFTGENMLLSVFVLTLASLFFILASYCTRSPYAETGGAREILQIMAEEPMSLFIVVVFFMATGSFETSVVAWLDAPAITTSWVAFLGFLFILTIKMRKSPFDLSTATHAHQELVRGTTTEMSGKTLAKVEVMHWLENVLSLGWVGVFFLWSNPVSIVVAIVAAAIAFILEILIDNNFARVKWQAMLKSAWVVALVAGGLNICFLAFI